MSIEKRYFYRLSWFAIIGFMLLGLIISALGARVISVELGSMSPHATLVEQVQYLGRLLVLPAVLPLFVLITWPSIYLALKGRGFLILGEQSITLWTGFFFPNHVTIPLSEIYSVKLRALGERPFANYLLGFKAGQKNFTLSQSSFRSKAQFDEVAEALISAAALNQRWGSS